MDFLKLHHKGKPFIVSLNGLNGAIPAIKGDKYVLVHDDENMCREFDESFDDLMEAMTVLEVEIMDIAND